jgi:hypothetical protein
MLKKEKEEGKYNLSADEEAKASQFMMSNNLDTQ